MSNVCTVIPTYVRIELDAGTELLASIAQRRRSTFASRAAAAASLRAKHPYAAFDPIAFDAFLSDGLQPTDTDTVQLSCAPATEAAVFRFAARESVATVFHRLGAVRAPAVVACGADTGEQFMWLPEGSKQVADALGNGIHTQYVCGCVGPSSAFAVWINKRRPSIYLSI